MENKNSKSQETKAMPYDAVLAVRLIAKFMGWADSVFSNLPNKMYKGDKGKNLSLFNYNTSWDELMPVYRKIRDIINERAKYDKHTRTKADLLELDVQTAICEVNIEKAFKASVEFAKWWLDYAADR